MESEHIPRNPLHKGIQLVAHTDPSHFEPSAITQHLPPAQRIMQPWPERFASCSVVVLAERLLLAAEYYAMRAWGSNAWEVLIALIERHRQTYWTDEAIERYASPIDRQRARRANRERHHHIAPELRQSIYERDGHQCLRCGAQDDLTIDHIVPIARGGKTEIANLRTLCRSCNSSAGGAVGSEGLRLANEKRQ